MSDRILVPVSIASGASQSAEVNINQLRVIGIIMPAGWDAASITFLALLREPSALPKAPVYGKVQDQAGAEAVVTAPALDTYVGLPPTGMVGPSGAGRIKVRSGTAGVAVNQTAQRDFFLVCVQPY